MKLQIVITCDDAAFRDDPNYELGRMLNKLVVVLARDGYGAATGDGIPLLDSNGNVVGRATLIR